MKNFLFSTVNLCLKFDKIKILFCDILRFVKTNEVFNLLDKLNPSITCISILNYQ